MAKFSGLLRKQIGSIGDLTFKQVNWVTIVSEKITQMTNPRTDGQMRTRTRWNNIVAMYKGIRPKLNKGFENKAAGLSDFNMFMKMNMQKEPVYLTKQAVAGGACVATAYQISQGSLPAIVLTGTGQNVKTDIRLGGESITANTTVAQFAAAVVQNNPDYRYGDQISFFLVKQMVNVAQDNQGMRSTMETTFALHHICHAQVSERTRERAEAEASRERVSSDA